MDFRIEGGGFEALDDARSWEFRDVGLENWWGGIAGERISERVEAAHWEGEGREGRRGQQRTPLALWGGDGDAYPRVCNFSPVPR